MKNKFNWSLFWRILYEVITFGLTHIKKHELDKNNDTQHQN